MADEPRQRRLAAILAADIVGYSRLMGADENATVTAWKSARLEVIDPKIEEFSGRIVKHTGDGFLAEFGSVTDAVECAIDLQKRLTARAENEPEDRRMLFRMGVNLGDIVEELDDIHGDGVNIAARLESLAEPGGVLVSQMVNESIAGKVDADFLDSGEREFKNISKPIRVWSWPRRLSANRKDSKPFVLVSGFKGRSDEEQQLAEDLGENIAAALSRQTGLEVTIDPRMARYVIRGDVRQAGQRYRISAQLISVDADKQIWAERYEEISDDPFDVLDRCVDRIAMTVRRRVAADDASRLSDKDLDQLSLEELLSLSGVSFFTPTKAGWLQGGEIAKRALQRDPKNFMALAMAAAGRGMAEMFFGFRAPDDAVINTAFRQIEEAQRLTNRSDMLLVVYSGLSLYGRGRHEEALAAAERSLQLNSNYNMGFWCLGAVKVFAGDSEAGIDAATRAVDIDIRDPYVHLYSRIAGYGHFAAARFKDAAQWFSKADQLAPGLPHNLVGLAASRWLDGDHKGARDAVARLLEEEPEFRIRDMLTLPFQNADVWERLVNGLRASGTPD